MNSKIIRKISLYLFIFLSTALWTACNHLEWRGSAIPKLVWSKSDSISIKNIQTERNLKTIQTNPFEKQNVTINDNPYWTQFRGPNSEGKYTEKKILIDWPKGGPKLVWRKLIGSGHSSFSIAEGYLYTIEQQEDKEVVVAFSASTGDLIWKYQYNAKFEEYFGGIGPRSTPTWNDQKIYSLGAEGDLKCLNSRSGKLIWKLNGNKDKLRFKLI